MSQIPIAGRQIASSRPGLISAPQICEDALLIYQFSDLQLDVGRRQLFRGDAVIKLTKLSFEVLRVLVQASPNVVSYEDLIRQAWGEKRIVTPENVAQRILMLRQSLGDDASNPKYVEGVRGQGLRLIPEVSRFVPEDGVVDRGVVGVSQTADIARKGYLRSRYLHYLAFGLTLTLAIVVAVKRPGIDPAAKTAEDELRPSDQGQFHEERSNVAVPPIDLITVPTIAVLPFVNMSDDPANEYFSDGVSEEIINTLVKQTRLPVIARTSSFQFKDQAIDGKVIGELLAASHLLEGSVRKSGRRVRVTAQLIDSASGVHLWSEQYDRQIDDLLEIQTEIAFQIVGEIRAQIDLAVDRRVPEIVGARIDVSPGKVHPEAYEAYLKGLMHRNRMLPDDIARALEYFAEACELDPTFAEAWKARIATQLLATGWKFLVTSHAQAYDNIETWLATIMPAEADNPEVKALHGVILAMNHYRWTEGLQEVEEALPYLDNKPGMLGYLAGIYFWLGQIERAVELMEQSSRLDPYDFAKKAALGSWYSILGRQREGDAMLEQGADTYMGVMEAGLQSFMRGNTTELDKNLRMARSFVRPDHPAIVSLESFYLLLKDDRQAAEELTRPLLDNMREQTVALGYLAIPNKRLADVYAMAEQQRQPIIGYWLLNGARDEIIAPYWEKLKLDELPEAGRGRTGLWTEAQRQELIETERLLSAESLRRFVGTYKASGQRIEITMVDGRLHHRRRYGAGWLIAAEEGRFLGFDENDFSVKFLANEEGVYDLCIWTVGQLSWYGYRET